MPASVTLADVARAAGVSLATASRAINGSATRTVRPELRERVLAVAADLNYLPNANAQAMARGHTTALGLIVHDIADPYFSTIAAGVSAAAEEADLMVTLGNTQHDPERELALVGVLHRQRARAIVIAGGRHDDEQMHSRLGTALDAYRSGGGSVAMISQPVLDIDTVAIDNAAGAGQLAGALLELGYRSFAVLAGPPGHLTARERLEGFTAALPTRPDATGPGAAGPDAAQADAAGPDAARNGQLQARHVIASEFTRDGGYTAMRELIDRADLPGGEVDAVFAVNDVMAVGAMAAARDAGVRVGPDVGVAGFDDIATLRDVSPALTTVQVPLHRAGTLATRMALGAPAPDLPPREAHDSGARLVHLNGTVVLRDSTPPRA